MQSKISFFNPTICKKNLTRFWPFALVYLVYLLIVHPLVIYTEFNRLLYDGYGQSAQSVVMNHFSGVTEPISIFIAAIIIAIAVFSYLYQSRSANMIHSFPVTRTQLFVTNYVSGLVLMIVPQLLGALFTNLVILGKAGSTIWIVWSWFGITVGETIFFYSFACLMVMFTGQMLTAGLFYMIWSFLYIVAVVLIDSMGGLFLYGVLGNLIVTRAHPLFPLAYMMRYVGFDVSGQMCHVEGVPAVIAYMAVGVLCAVLAWWIYQHRRIECAGDFLSMKWTAPVFRWGVVLVGATGCALFATDIINSYGSWNGRIARFVIGLVFFSVVLFFASEMFIEKSFRVFHKKLIVECVSCVAVLLVGVAMLNFDVFGVESYVPQTDEVAMAYAGWNNMEVDVEDAAQIEQVQALHQLIIDHMGEQKQYTDGRGNMMVPDTDVYYQYVTLTYTLKNGKWVERNYTIVIQDQDYRDQLNDQIRVLSADTEGIVSGILGLNHEDLGWKINYAGVEFPTIDNDTVSYDGSTDVGSVETRQELFDAWLADVQAGAFDIDGWSNGTMVNFRFETNAPKSQVRYPKGSSLDYKLSSYDGANGATTTYLDVNVNERCTHLLQVLKDIGVIDDTEEVNVSVE